MGKTMRVWVIMLMWAARCQAAGFESVAIPDGAGATIELAVWYPSDAPTRPRDMGVFSQDVASGGAVRGTGLPLVVVSHGTGGNAYTHLDTALALADAGFVVAALTHPGDNHQDRSRATDILARPRQVTAVIDYMTGRWNKRAALAAGRIGIFGHSSGGFTALVGVGARPDLARVAAHCAAHAADFACALVSAAPRLSGQPYDARLRDGRIKAAVIAAPALGFTFDAAGLSEVTVPIQLWRAEDDAVLPHPGMPRRCARPCREHRITAWCRAPATSTSWRRAARSWRASRRRSARAGRGSTAPRFTAISMHRSWPFSERRWPRSEGPLSPPSPLRAIRCLGGRRRFRQRSRTHAGSCPRRSWAIQRTRLGAGVYTAMDNGEIRYLISQSAVGSERIRRRRAFLDSVQGRQCRQRRATVYRQQRPLYEASHAEA